MLYASGDDRRDSGYSLFYLGINIGAFLAPLACGTIGEVYGWHYGFALAAIGVTAGMIIHALNLGPLPARSSAGAASEGRKSVVVGNRGAERVDIGGRRMT